MKKNKFNYILIIIFILFISFLFFVIKHRPFSSKNSEIKNDKILNTEDIKDSVKDSDKFVEIKNSDSKAIINESDFEKAYKLNDKEDILYAGKDASFEKFLSYNKPAFINFTWIQCAPCKEMAPDILSIYDKFKGKALIKDVEVTLNSEFANEIGIRVTPTQLFIPKNENFKFSEKAMEVMDNYFSKVTIGNKSGYMHQGVLDETQMNILISELIDE